MSAPRAAGVTVFLTGLSGAGKSTVADALVADLAADGRQVTVLDGDVVRTHLSSELTFSREHRDLNIRRIGFVAGEVVKHGGIVVVAAIAPYEQAREEARAQVERHGRFVLVHLATPLEVCEQRDVKGLYARARAGEIPEFTGISDPYEPPARAEVTIDTSVTPLDESVARIRTAMNGASTAVS
jgi:adenylyl-sulfate kinase